MVLTIARINFFYGASPLTTVGSDINYNILPDLPISGGYYYQYSEKEGDKYEKQEEANGAGTAPQPLRRHGFKHGTYHSANELLNAEEVVAYGEAD